jgi:hypothetical protein
MEHYDKQKKTIENLQRSFMLSEAFNGHTIVPLCDNGMEAMLKVVEENNGESIVYWLTPYKLKVIQNAPKYSFDKDSITRIGIDIEWKVDIETWERYKKKFSKKYPKSIAKLKEKLEECE